MTQTRSIDVAARGYIRHRFVRALTASFVVLTMFAFIGLTIAPLLGVLASGEWEQIVAAPLGVALVVLLFVFPTILIVGLVGALIDVLHRRLVGLVIFVASLVAAVFLSLVLITFIFALFGVGDIGEGETQASLLAGALFELVGALISYQLARQGWWQMTASAADFRATRGWRPPAWRVFTSFRRHLGLPSFLAHVGKKRTIVTLLYFAVAVLNLGLVMLLMLPMALIGENERTAQFDPYIVIAVMALLLVLNLLGAGALLSRLADRRATILYQGVREWDARAPISFLRAFDQDAARLKAVGGDAFTRWPAGVGRTRTLDEILLEHASPYGPVIAIGDPRDPTPPLGAARVFVEGGGEEWQSVVRGLAGASKAVVMCPNHGEGVKWELDLISQAGGRLHVIFLASPELDREATHALFRQLVPGMPKIAAEQRAIAAYEIGGEWRVLTARRLSVDSYTAALNTALQALFGLKGEPAKRPAKAA